MHAIWPIKALTCSASVPYHSSNKQVFIWEEGRRTLIKQISIKDEWQCGEHQFLLSRSFQVSTARKALLCPEANYSTPQLLNLIGSIKPGSGIWILNLRIAITQQPDQVLVDRAVRNISNMVFYRLAETFTVFSSEKHSVCVGGFYTIKSPAAVDEDLQTNHPTQLWRYHCTLATFEFKYELLKLVKFPWQKLKL